MLEAQDIRFCATADGVNLAYAITGSGPPLVKAANWLSHLEYDLQSPVWRHLIAGLSGRFSLLRYDERGTGLSDWDVASISFEDMVSDLEAVVDATGYERFPLIGISQGAPVAITYAVEHPERVSHLVLLGGYERGRLARNSRADEQDHALFLALAEAGWGTDEPSFRHVFTSQFIPDGSSAQHQWFDELMRVSTSTENAMELLRTLASIDVADLAPQVSVPTLVLHASGDRRVPFDLGRQLAASIPGARLVRLDSNNHLPLEPEPAWRRILAEIDDFLGVQAPVDEATGHMTGMMMTDIVESTRLADAIGDAAWLGVLAWHDRTTREILDAHSGEEAGHTGDGFLATFPSGAKALDCAVALLRRFRDHRNQAGFAPTIRIGVHAGEITWVGGNIAGVEVHKAARVAAAAAPDEILVSEPLATATADSFRFSSMKAIPAKGIDQGMEVRALRWS